VGIRKIMYKTCIISLYVDWSGTGYTIRCGSRTKCDVDCSNIKTFGGICWLRCYFRLVMEDV